MSADAPSRRIGPYEVLRSLGAGGMGEVHLALDRYGRTVAVKTIHTYLLDRPSIRTRLGREVETMRLIEHPRVASVLDFDLEGATPYLVTRYAQGRPLDTVVTDDGPFGGDALTAFVIGGAEAVAAVHAARVVHRDIKPGNVMVADGMPIIIDFGIAHAVDATRLTQDGRRAGTLWYMAPELWDGGSVGPAADVFAWAATMAYAATGRHIFQTPHDAGVYASIRSGRPDLEGVPDGLRGLLSKALSVDPADRPDAAELVARLHQLRGVATEPDPAPQVAQTAPPPGLVEAPPGPVEPPGGEPSGVLANADPASADGAGGGDEVLAFAEVPAPAADAATRVKAAGDPGWLSWESLFLAAVVICVAGMISVPLVDGRRGFKDLQALGTSGPKPAYAVDGCVMFGCLGSDKERGRSMVRYRLSASVFRAQTSYRVTGWGDRFIHALPVVERARGCSANARLAYRVAGRTGTLPLRTGQKTTIEYDGLGSPATFEVEFRLDDATGGCTATVGLQDAYLHRLPPALQFFANNRES
ncbi:serine/threonine-protein kinase [Spirillospora sp. NPDC047279]|uniref:serine/threonine-protein kinase n=1 Tax=Spirillospora sp. NPDC047279 TaxID=3155478 RepID=UPI0033F93DB1